jgi:hypothetical protein
VQESSVSASSACTLFGNGYSLTRGGYPAGCDEDSFLALFDTESPTAVAVDKQCNRCGPTGYYARISEFAAPFIGQISEMCRQGRLQARPCAARTCPYPILRPLPLTADSRLEAYSSPVSDTVTQVLTQGA